MANNGQDVANDLESGIKKAFGFNGISSASDAMSNIENKAKDLYQQGKSAVKRAIQGPTTIHESSNPKTLEGKPVPKYHKGTDYVPKTGPAILKKGEAVLKKEDADKYRKGKDMYNVHDELAGKKEEKPKKEIDHIKVKKAHNHGHIITHVHTRPDVHPNEDHITNNDDELANHMLEHIGTPNPGEADADAGISGIEDNMGSNSNNTGQI